MITRDKNGSPDTKKQTYRSHIRSPSKIKTKHVRVKSLLNHSHLQEIGETNVLNEKIMTH